MLLGRRERSLTTERQIEHAGRSRADGEIGVKEVRGGVYAAGPAISSLDGSGAAVYGRKS